jgi:hypothetical protein
VPLADAPAGVEAVAVGEHQVEQDQVVAVPVHLPHRLGDGAGRGDGEPLRLQQLLQRAARQQLVLHHQY